MRAPAAQPRGPGPPGSGTQDSLPGAGPACALPGATPAAGHSPSGGPGARPQQGGRAVVSSSSSSGSSTRAAPGQPRPATPMEGAAAAGRGGGARASTVETLGGVCGRPARCALTPPARPRLAPEPRPHFHTVLPGRGGLRGGSAAPTGPPSFPLPASGAGGAAAVARRRLSAWRGRAPSTRTGPGTKLACSRTPTHSNPQKALCSAC